MLAGRESLIRLIGKRRRYLPNFQSIISTPIQNGLNLLSERNGSVSATKGEDISTAWEAESDSSRITCPVCGTNVSGEDYAINSHLDECLSTSRRTKRKLTQSTLLKWNIGTPSKVQSLSTENKSPAGSVQIVTDIGYVEENEDDHEQSPSDVESVKQASFTASTRVSIINDSSGANSALDVTLNDTSSFTLDAFIVGRRYSDKTELTVGQNISLLREPDNANDSNAIKVLSKDCCKVLGYLPRELAKHLSPLIDQYGLTFEGCLIACPSHLFDTVSIRLVCHEMTLNVAKEPEEFDVLKQLWKKALEVANHPPNVKKYQINFCLLLQEALRSNPHLFTDDERKFFESFTSLSEDSQRLFVRLYARKGPWFRLSTISYHEVFNFQEAIKELCENGYFFLLEDISGVNFDDMEKILCLLTVSELRDVSCFLKKSCNRGSRKQCIVASLLSYYKDSSCPRLLGAIREKIGTCFRISSVAESLIWRAERLFFLNGEQDLSAFLLVDLGIVKYPTYNCMISKPIFSSRKDLLAYEEAIEVAQIMDQSLDEGDTELVLHCVMIADSRMMSDSMSDAHQSTTSRSVAMFHARFSASWVYSKVVLLGVSFLEREHRYKDAIHLLKCLLNCFKCDGRRGYWTVRLSIDLEHIDCPNESLSVAEAGVIDPWVRAGSRVALQRRVLRLGRPPRRWKVPSFSEFINRRITEVHVYGRPLNCKTGAKSRFYGEDGEQCGVEQLALQYYSGKGGQWKGIHAESGILLTIFSLLMWDVLFTDLPDVFYTKFQTAPLDLETDSFYLARQESIETELEKIRVGMAEEMLIMSWESHLGTACRGVNWNRFSLSDLRAAVACIGGSCLASLCRYVAQDYRNWSRGMPDLLLWRFHGDYRGGEAKLVEVKGPRDQLSEQQRACLLLLMDCGFHVEVCKVSPKQLD